jgi:type 1 fimbriae regulatory protein FimB/type 1 fimbriae regulatory protein FimE
VRKPNKELRQREYLTESELDSLRNAASKTGRYGHRDSTLIMVMYRHGLRVSEAIDLRWEQIDFTRSTIHVTRLKNGDASVHPLVGEELRALRKLRRDFPASSFVFNSERQGPLTARAVHKIIARAGKLAGTAFPCHPHQLRHSTGFALASAGVDTRALQLYLGHRNIQHTVTYTQLSASRFKDFGKLL